MGGQEGSELKLAGSGGNGMLGSGWGREICSSHGSSYLTIHVERNPSPSRLSELQTKSWPKWGCPPGKYYLKFDAEEICYFLKGKVKAQIKEISESVEFGAGDLVIIPKGLSCTWEVFVAVDKYYKFQ
ncbi:hypothetical protein IEQ34_009342 [Dendrobium chrysotoxum]|uniref:(S)-ureidoglycine aminohydrolase cupin domain-containing protein n=1 Tax=Dendrobium chrysotoxum TaxID=161865 RepID=A0AAV7H0C2_DENCH|nr:hypothetical protein IEQ34_009342 [Dendrobium chrysotoxum]